jgi:hypothetical protein
MFIYKRNLTPYLAQTKLPKAVYDHVSFASEILALLPPYKMGEVEIIATPAAGQRRPKQRPTTRHGRRIQTALPRRG